MRPLTKVLVGCAAVQWVALLGFLGLLLSGDREAPAGAVWQAVATLVWTIGALQAVRVDRRQERHPRS